MARFRFNINLINKAIVTDPKATKRLSGENFATTVIRDLGLRYADRRYNKFKAELTNEISEDVRREIAHLAKQYVHLIVGAANVRASSPTLTSSSRTATESGGFSPWTDHLKRPGSAANSTWAPLNKDYVQQKRRQNFSPNFFLRQGNLGLDLGKGDDWTQIFGPILVKVARTAANTASTGGPTLSDSLVGTRNAVIRFSIAKVEVRALGKVTAAMIPALVGGELGFQAKNAHRTGLLGLVYNADPELEYRLAGKEGHVPYRPSLEPFLGFVLTRSIPFAVKNRILSKLGGGDYPDVRYATSRDVFGSRD